MELRYSSNAEYQYLYRRFPVISGFRVEWDSRKPPGQRVLNVCLQEEVPDDESTAGSEPGTPSGAATPAKFVNGEPIKREKGGRKYKIVTRYVAH